MTKEEKTTKIKKDNEQIIMVDTKESVNAQDDELTDRINRLYGISSNVEKEKKEYEPKELEEVRKKLIFLLMGVVLCGMVVLFILFNPFTSNNKSDSSGTGDSNIENPSQESEIPIGEIELSNTKVTELNSLISFSITDSMEIDLFPLYGSDSLDAVNIPNNIKLYLLKRSVAFSTLLESVNIEEYVKTCDANGLLIPKEDFDKTVTKLFGPNVVVEYSDINYSYYGASQVNKLTLSHTENGYLIKCNDYAANTNLVKYVAQRLSRAVKTEDTIEIYQNVVFINETGVYKDSLFTSLITNDPNATVDDYMPSGTLYKYTFTENGDNFYLSKIEKVQETN